MSLNVSYDLSSQQNIKKQIKMQETDDVGFFFEQYYMLIFWFVYLVVD